VTMFRKLIRRGQSCRTRANDDDLFLRAQSVGE
jgi:hypothetical protein